MKEIAKVYIGNIVRDRSLARKVTHSRKENRILEVTLQESDRSKGRILAQSTDGVAVGIVKNRELKLRSGDVFQTTENNLVLIHLETETLMVLTLDEAIESFSGMELVRLGHLLGNQHCPIKIEENKIYVRPIGDLSVLTRKIEELSFSGITITWEQTAKMRDAIVHHYH